MTLLREPARPAVIREHPLAPWFAVAAVCFGAFMGQLDASVVTVAFPALQRQFGAGLAAVQWVSLAYLLVLTALLVPAGRWSDRAGPQAAVPVRVRGVRRLRRPRCGLAPSLGVLIALRVVQAAGAALLQANSVALVVTSVPARTRRAALGVQAAAQAVGLASGPVIGGLLVAAVGWRWVFFLNVPVGVLAVVAGVLPAARARDGAAGQLPGRQPTLRGRGDWPWRIVLLAARRRPGCWPSPSLSGLGLPAWAVARARGRGRASPRAALLRHERRAAAPLLDLRAHGRRGHRRRRCSARSAPTWSCSGRWCCSRRWSPPRAAAPRRRACCSPRCPPGSGSPPCVADRLLPARWPNRRRCAARRRARGRLRRGAGGARARMRYRWCCSACSASALASTLRRTTPRSWPRSRARDAAAAGGMVNMTRGSARRSAWPS